MRIIGGHNRGTQLASVGVGDAKAHLRPTSDRVRESIFNLLINGGYGNPINNARVLDLFAGTGALGLEALSRGASFAQFVDDGKKAKSLILQNIERLRVQDKTKVLIKDATNLPKHTDTPFDLIFADPPYGKSMGEKALLSAQQNGWANPNTLFIFEENTQIPIPPQFETLDIRRYGDTIIHILKPTS